jgi:hypothetical protein
MQKKWKAKWIKALLSGSYRQATTTLIERKKGKRAGYCCLGVLVRVQGGKFDECGYPILGNFKGDSFCVLDLDELACGLTDNEKSKLMDMNDTQRLSFRKIAAYIKKEIPGE